MSQNINMVMGIVSGVIASPDGLLLLSILLSSLKGGKINIKKEVILFHK